MSRSRLGSGVCLLLLLSAFGPSVPGCAPPRPESGSLSPVAPSVDTTARLAHAGDVPLHVHNAITPEERDRYTGSLKCVSCHAEQAGQLDTHHADTLSVADASHAWRFSRGGDREDSVFGVTYRTRYRDGACVLEARSGE